MEDREEKIAAAHSKTFQWVFEGLSKRVSAALVLFKNVAGVERTALLDNRESRIWEIDAHEIHMFPSRARIYGDPSRHQGSVREASSEVGRRQQINYRLLLLLELRSPDPNVSKRPLPHIAIPDSSTMSRNDSCDLSRPMGGIVAL
jgi:hypothetical protein